MKYERILAYQMSQKLSEEDLQDVTAAESTASATGRPHFADADADYRF